jgi:hypothetical protein
MSSSSKKNKNKHIKSQTKKVYKIYKAINRKNIYYGTYYTLNDARLVRDNLEKHEWNKECLDEICEEVGVYRIHHGQKMTRGGHKYTLWDSHKVQYHKNVTGTEKRFRVLWNHWSINIGLFLDFITCEIIYDLVDEIVFGKRECEIK